MIRAILFLAAAAAATANAQAAEPIRIGITTVLSGPTADRGQSEQYGAQLALDRINEAGGVLGRPLEAYYADNACKPDIGVPATRRLIEQQHVPVVIGALCTPVTHAIMPVMAQAKVPLVIATSAGQDFVDASGPDGNDYAFKTIPSETDIAAGLIRWLTAQKARSIAVVTDPAGFLKSNADAFAAAAKQAGITVTDVEVLAPGADMAATIGKLRTGNPDQVVAVLGPSTAPFFRAWEASGWKLPVTGRFDVAAAQNAVSPAFRGTGLADISSVAVFSTAQNTQAVQDFVAGYRAHTGLTPTQRSFFVYEAVYWVADAIQRAGTDTQAAIEAALKTTAMPSLLGGTYALDAHNHPHTPILVVGLRNGLPAVIGSE